MAEARNAFRTLVKEAPEKLQLRIQQLLDSLVFKDELSTTKTELEAGQTDQGTYVHIASADTITAKHTFAPASATAPFALGSNALAQLVTGLNADYLDSQHGSYYLNASNINAGTLAVSYGGTGLNSLATGRIPYGAGTSAFGSSATLVYTSSSLGVGTAGPDRTLDVLHASNPQIRLTQADGTVYTDLQTDSSGYFNITPSGTRATLTGSLIATKTITSADADGTRHFSFTANSNTDPAASAEVNSGYFAYNKTAGSNGTYIVNALEGVYRSQYADESSTGRGVYGRFYIDPASSATLRTGVGIEASARASYGGGTEIAAEAGTAFVGSRIWMAPYFSAATVGNVNNFWGLWIYGEHATQRNADAAIKIGDAGGGWAELINGTNPTGPGFTLGATLNNATGNEVAFTLNSTTNKLTSGDDTLLELVQTDTASPGTSYLINAKVATASKFNVLNTGAGTFAGSLTIGSAAADIDYTLTFDGETTDGVLTWMEDEDYFKFSDDILMDAAEKIQFRDTAIGVYSQADTFLDIFADGGLRIGDSSAGAPTNYTNFSADGTMTMVGTAKVTKEIRLEPTTAVHGASAPTDALRAVGASGGVLLPVDKFSKTTQQDLHFVFHAPSDIDDDTNVEFHLMWLPGSAWTAGNYMWKLEYLVFNENGTYTAGTPTTISADVTPANATTMIETEFTSTIDLNAEQFIVGHFYRDVASDNGDDTGDVYEFELEYTSNKLGQ